MGKKWSELGGLDQRKTPERSEYELNRCCNEAQEQVASIKIQKVERRHLSRGQFALLQVSLLEVATRGRPEHRSLNGQGCQPSREVGPPLLPKPAPEARCHFSPGAGTAS